MDDASHIPKQYRNGATANPTYSPSQPKQSKRQKTTDVYDLVTGSIKNNREKPDFGTTETELGKAFDSEAIAFTFSILDNFESERVLYEIDANEKKEVIKKLFDLDNKILKLKNSHLQECTPSALLNDKIPSTPLPTFGGGKFVQFNCGGSDISIDFSKFCPDNSEIFGQLLSGPFKDCFMKNNNGSIFLDLNPMFLQCYMKEKWDHVKASMHPHWHQRFDYFKGIPKDVISPGANELYVDMVHASNHPAMLYHHFFHNKETHKYVGYYHNSTILTPVRLSLLRKWLVEEKRHNEDTFGTTSHDGRLQLIHQYSSSSKNISKESYLRILENNLKGKEGTICIMELVNGNIVGGYNPGKWEDIPEGEDHLFFGHKNAFIFQLNGNSESTLDEGKKYKARPSCSGSNLCRMVGFGPIFGTDLTMVVSNISGRVQLIAECHFQKSHYGEKANNDHPPQGVHSNIKYFEVHVVLPFNDNFNKSPPTNNSNFLAKEIESVDHRLKNIGPFSDVTNKLINAFNNSIYIYQQKVIAKAKGLHGYIKMSEYFKYNAEDVIVTFTCGGYANIKILKSTINILPVCGLTEIVNELNGNLIVSFDDHEFMSKFAEFLRLLKMEFLGLIPYSSFKLDSKYKKMHQFGLFFAGMESFFFE